MHQLKIIKVKTLVKTSQIQIPIQNLKMNTILLPYNMQSHNLRKYFCEVFTNVLMFIILIDAF